MQSATVPRSLPLAEGVEAGQDLGGTVVIQADAAD